LIPDTVSVGYLDWLTISDRLPTFELVGAAEQEMLSLTDGTIWE
jgi:hypothetical protein